MPAKDLIDHGVDVRQLASVFKLSESSAATTVSISCCAFFCTPGYHGQEKSIDGCNGGIRATAIHDDSCLLDVMFRACVDEGCMFTITMEKEVVPKLFETAEWVEYFENRGIDY